MRLLSLLALCATALAISPSSADSTAETTIYIQPITLSPSAPLPLASIKYSSATLSSELLSYSPPEIDSDSQLLRIGIYHPASQTWVSSTTATSSSSFEKGYAPTIILSLDNEGGVLGVSVKSAKIDAGQTRDFGPRVRVRGMVKGKGPVMNERVVLGKGGKVEEVVVEKTLLQRYWWVGLGAVMLLMTTGGAAE